MTVAGAPREELSREELPRVEMLWETSNPLHALATRFGFDGAGSASGWVTATVREHWGIVTEACERIVISDRNALAWITTPRGRLLAKWSTSPGRFRYLSETSRLVRRLADRGLPVSAPLPSLDGRVQVEVDGASMSLQRVVEGELLDVSNPAQVHAAGAVLARLHRALADYPGADLLAPPADPVTRISAWLTDSTDAEAARGVPSAVRDALRRRIADAPSDPMPTHLVHGDFRSANILCVGDEVVAVIDFEEVRLDHRVAEVARSAVMLGTRFRDWGPVSVDVHATFRAGYESVCRLTPVEARWWDAFVLWTTAALVPPGDDPTGWGAAALALATPAR